MEAIIRKWTEEDKILMIKVSRELNNVFKKYCDNDICMASYILAQFTEAYNIQAGLERIRTLDKKGRSDIFVEEKRAREILEGLLSTEYNIVLFRNEPEVWFQLYLGFYFKKPTYIMALDENAELLHPIKANKYMQEIVLVKQFSDDELLKAMNKITGMIKK